MKRDSQLTQSGVVMGSPSYMPPEQAAGRHGDIGPSSDVYSLGAMLYELLTGRPPFRGETAMATLHDVMEAEPVALRKLKADVPIDLETICLKCLEKSPAARYPTAQALADELDRFLKGEPIQARPASIVKKAVSWSRRHPGTLMAVTVLAIVSLAFGVFYLWEENAFLLAQAQNAALTRIPGWRHAMLLIWHSLGVFAYGGAVIVFFFVWGRTRGVSVFKDNKDKFDYFAVKQRPLQALNERTRTLAFAAGMLWLGLGIMLLMGTIHAHVWEGESIWGSISIICYLICAGLATLRLAICDYCLVNYGRPIMGPPQMTEEESAALAKAHEKARAAMVERWDRQAALQAYCDALPAWSQLDGDAVLFVNNLREALRAEQPEKFAYPALSLANISWRGMVKCALIEAAVHGATRWYNQPVSEPSSTALLFAYSFLFGVATRLCGRVGNVWVRVMLLAPAVLTVAVSQSMLQLPGWQWRITAGILWAFVVILVSTSAKGGCLKAFLLVLTLLVLLLGGVELVGRTSDLCFYGFVFGIVLISAGLSGEGDRALQKKLRGSGPIANG
jgi:hypothetical protein